MNTQHPHTGKPVDRVTAFFGTADPALIETKLTEKQIEIFRVLLRQTADVLSDAFYPNFTPDKQNLDLQSALTYPYLPLDITM